jgi:hypothetical protein
LFLEAKKLLVLNVNGMLCYFQPSAILQGNARVFGKNVDEVRVKVENFLSKAFQKFISQFDLV